MQTNKTNPGVETDARILSNTECARLATYLAITAYPDDWWRIVDTLDWQDRGVRDALMLPLLPALHAVVEEIADPTQRAAYHKALRSVQSDDWADVLLSVVTTARSERGKNRLVTLFLMLLNAHKISGLGAYYGEIITQARTVYGQERLNLDMLAATAPTEAMRNEYRRKAARFMPRDESLRLTIAQVIEASEKRGTNG